MENRIGKNLLKMTWKILRGTFRFTLLVIFEMLNTPAKKKEYEPTMHEIMCGEKIPFSEKYFIPDEKYRK